MAEQPQANSTDLPPIDTSNISIEIIELDPPDYQFDFKVPVDLISEITDRIQSGGLEYDEQQMGELIVQVCLDEGMRRLDRDSAWGTRLLANSVGKFSTNEPFTFSAIVDVLPEEDVPIDTIPIKRNQFQVDDALVDSEMLEQQLQFGSRNEHNGELAHGDEINCNATITILGEEEASVSLEKCTIRIPSNTQKFKLRGLPLEDIGSQLRDSQCAKEMTFDIDFPEEYPSRKFRGKKGILKLANCSFVRITPAPIEHILEQYGTPNEAILRTQIKMSLQHNFDRENTNFMMHQLYEYMLENIEVPVSNRIINNNYNNLCKKELEAHEEEELTDHQKSMLQARAARLVKRITLNAWLQRTYRLGISEVDIDKQAAILAEERRVRPSDIKEEFLSEDKVTILGNMASERKIFEHLQDKMVFSDIQ